jgi:hypothetical protein
VTAWPDDDDLWRSVETTLRDVIIPALDDDWAALCAVQLVGLARYARTRGDDPRPARAAELAQILGDLRDNLLVNWDGDPRFAAVVAACSAALVRATGSDDDDAEAADVRARLQPVLIDHLDDDLIRSAPTMRGFRGQLPDD